MNCPMCNGRTVYGTPGKQCEWCKGTGKSPFADIVKEAERYRWLRNNPSSHLYVRHNDNGQVEVVTGETLDQLIDARLKP